jgi:hypothetical protein
VLAGGAWHISSLAQPLSDGWRAAGPIGYSNVTGLVLLLGLLCASAVAAVSGRTADEVRCVLLATGTLATQSRSVALGALACLAVLWFTSRPVAWVLRRSSLWALVALTGLLPSIRGHGYGGIVATLALAATLCLVVRRPVLPSPRRRTRAVLMAGVAAAAGLVAVTLRGRIFDGGSDDGRIQLWLNALRQLHWTGFFGAGPAQLAQLSRGELVTLLTHSDPLQYAQYYGVPGMAALVLVGVRAGVLLVRRRGAVPPEMWGTGVSATIAVACVMAVDYPLQVPLIPALTCLIIGAVVGVRGPGTGPPVPGPAREPAGAAGSAQAASGGVLDPVASTQ